MDPMLIAAVALLGALIGSFLNVVVHRVPAGMSLAHPPSACPACGNRIRPYDNVPVVSWLVLRGRCRDCRTGIPARYPLVEAGTAVFFAVVALALLGPLRTPSAPVAGSLLELSAFLVLAASSVALAVIDVQTHRLPDRIVLPTGVALLVLLVAAGLLDADPARIGRALIGAVALFLVYLLLAIARPGGMGMGDVKLAAVLGLALGWAGWAPLVVGGFAAFVLGGVYSVVLLAAGRVRRSGGIPFGPWMLLGAWTGVFAGSAVAAGYLAVIGVG